MISRFDKVEFDDHHKARLHALREKFKELEKIADEHLPQGRARNLFFVQLEQTFVWAAKSLREGQLLSSETNKKEPANVTK